MKPDLKPIVALSTSWCSQRHTDGYAMAREMADLGFSHLELSHGIRITLVPGILRALEEGVVKVCSTHNFCPLPTGVLQAAPNLYEPSAFDPRERDQWLRQTRRSIDFAGQIKAKAVVCHLGSVHFLLFNPARRLTHYLKKQPETPVATDDRYRSLVAKALKKLRKKMPDYWQRTQESVLLALEHAAEKNVRLVFENRERFEELPVDADFPAFLAELPTTCAGYWHDTGHAYIKETQGLIDHRRQLTENENRLVGFHLHDVNAEGRDHQAVGSGRIDFKMIRRFWRPDHLLVVELGPRCTEDDVKASRERIETLMEDG